NEENIDRSFLEVFQHLRGINAIGIQADADITVPTGVDDLTKLVVNGWFATRNSYKFYVPSPYLVEEPLNLIQRKFIQMLRAGFIETVSATKIASTSNLDAHIAWNGGEDRLNRGILQ